MKLLMNSWFWGGACICMAVLGMIQAFYGMGWGAFIAGIGVGTSVAGALNAHTAPKMQYPY